MHLIKLDAIDSTNTYLKNLMRTEKLFDYTVVSAKNQHKGRGQRNASWESELGKNLTFSVLKKELSLSTKDYFKINCCVSLAIYECLHQNSIQNLHIKWPNDIMSGNSKICGILIENTLSGSTIHDVIIGIGLNVNQVLFPNLKNVSSLKLLKGESFDLNALLHQLISQLKFSFDTYLNLPLDTLIKMYEQYLFNKDVVSNYKDEGDLKFKGAICGVTQEGKLMVVLESGKKRVFGLKEIHYLN